MDSQAFEPIPDPVALQAADWMLELQDRGVGEQRLAAWQAWLAEDPRHRQAFDRLQTVQECIDALPKLPWPSAMQLAAEMPQPARVTNKPRLALAASVVVLLTGTVLYVGTDLMPSGAHNRAIETTVGELRRVPLSDGSTLTAGGHSRLTVQFAATRREIRLEQGEAFFEVASDPVRPFVVHAGDTTVRALGTAFNVRRTGTHTVIAVAQGLVEARSPAGVTQLMAGQQLRLGPQLPPKTITMASTAVASWREGQRQYRAEPLADVIADLARYSTRRISIEDEAIGELAVTGTVFERDIDKWLNSLESALPVEVRTDTDGTVRIEARR